MAEDGKKDTKRVAGATSRAKLSELIANRVRASILGQRGYGNPPTETRFKKGQSGNPKGRPKAVPSDLSYSDLPSLADVTKVAWTKVKVIQHGVAEEMSTREAVMRAQVAAALKGNARSAGLVLDEMRAAEQALAREVKEDNAKWGAYQQTAREIIAEYEARGEAPPLLLPHPDDIVLDCYRGPVFTGPITDDDQRKLEDSLALRDVLLLQDCLDDRMDKRPDGTPFTDRGAAFVMARLLDDHAIPKRLRWSDNEIQLQMLRHRRLTTRELLKILYRRWRAIGRPKPRGYVSPDLGKVEHALETLTSALRDLRNGRRDTDALVEEILGAVRETRHSASNCS